MQLPLTEDIPHILRFTFPPAMHQNSETGDGPMNVKGRGLIACSGEGNKANIISHFATPVIASWYTSKKNLDYLALPYSPHGLG